VLGAVLSIGAQAADPTLPGEVLLQLSSADALAPLLLKYRLSLVDRFGARPIFRLKVIDPTTTQTVLGTLALEPTVLSAEANVVHSAPEARRVHVWAIGTPTDYVAQWAPQAMHLAEAHAVSTGAGVRVAVLDTGVDATHPALAGHLLPGFDFVDFDNDPAEVGTAANAGFGHGTHVAGLVALAAPGARIVPMRVLDAQGMGNAWVLSEALLKAIDPDGDPSTDDGAQVVSMSLSSLTRTRLFSTIAQLSSCNLPVDTDPAAAVFADPGYNDDKTRCTGSGGAVIVAAVGNDGPNGPRQYPAAEAAYGELAVAASDSTRHLASFSNTGSWVNLAAPGAGITSSVPGGGYGTWSGTSMAAPLVAGTVALLRSANPSMTSRDVTRRILRTTSIVCGTNLGQVDAFAALTNVSTSGRSCK
jgi:subtilisin family serine protease